METESVRRRALPLAAALLVLLLGSLAAAGARAHAVATEAVQPGPLETVSGTVLTVQIDDRVSGKSGVYRELRLDGGGSVSLTGDAAAGLQAGAHVLLAGHGSGDALEATDVQVLSAPLSVRSELLAEGTLTIAHADDFAGGHSQFRYHVWDAAGRPTRLNVVRLPALLRSGSQVQVSGRLAADGTSLDPDSITVLAEASGTGMVAKSGTTNSVLVIMANFNNTAAPSYTAAQAQQIMVSNSDSVANYYNEVSYGGQLLNVTVTSTWVTMNLAATCDFTQINPAANTAALALNSTYNAANYAFVVYLFPSQSCGWAGLAYVGYPHQAFINGTGSFITQVVAHEMGHNFGLLHAGSLSCGSAAIGGSCSVAEYGDPWDTMGNQHAGHFNAVQKSILGWIPSTSVKTHSSGSASYTLSPLESAGGGTYAVKIPTTNANRTYWLEFRQPIGFDSILSSSPTNGVQVRVASPFEWASGADDTELVDMTPASSGGFGDSALVAGQSFLDSTTGVNIIVTSASASAVTVSVTKGGASATTTTLASSVNPSTAGATVTFTATVSGTGPTGTVSFKDGSNSLVSCGAVSLTGSGNTRTAACTTSSLTTGTHSLTASYGGDSNNAASSSSALSQTVNGSGSTVGLGTSLTPSTVGTSVTFTATVSGSSPTGTVNFKDGSSSISGCTASALGGSGNVRTATCATAGLTMGTHSITAAYSGDGTNAAATSSALTQTVNKANASTGLASSVNPANVGASITFTATVTGFGPTGAINFKDGSSSITGCSAVTLAGSGNTRTAQCSTNGLSAATHSIVASYGGDGNNAASSSSTLSEVVNSGAPPSSLVNGGFEIPALGSASYQYNPSAAGIGWTFSANSGIESNGSAWAAATAPDGTQAAFIQRTGSISQTLTLGAGLYTLSFKAAQRACCSAPNIQPLRITLDGVQVGGLISPASTSFSTYRVALSVASSGVHTIGFTGTDPSDKSTFVDSVSLASGGVTATTATVASAVDPAKVNKSVAFTATVTGSNPTGTVAFTSGGSKIFGCGAVNLAGSGNAKTARCTTSFSKAGTYAIVANYAGDGGNGAAASTPLSQVIQPKN